MFLSTVPPTHMHTNTHRDTKQSHTHINTHNERQSGVSLISRDQCGLLFSGLPQFALCYLLKSPDTKPEPSEKGAELNSTANSKTPFGLS